MHNREADERCQCRKHVDCRHPCPLLLRLHSVHHLLLQQAALTGKIVVLASHSLQQKALHVQLLSGKDHSHFCDYDRIIFLVHELIIDVREVEIYREILQRLRDILDQQAPVRVAHKLAREREKARVDVLS